MTFAARLVAYSPGGARLTDVLLDAVDWDASFPHDDVAALSLSYPSVADAAVELVDGPVEIAVEVSDGGAWVEPRNARFLSSEVQSNDSQPLDVPKFTFRGLGALLERPMVLRKADNPGKPYDSDDKRNFLSATAGQIVLSVVQESRAKYSKMLDGIDFGFTASTDSLGKPWNKLDSLAFEPGTDLLRILDDATARGICDWWMQGRTLHIVNADSAAVTRSLRLNLVEATEAPVRATFEGMATRVALEGAEGRYWEKTIPGASVPYGDKILRSASDAISTDGTALDLLDRNAVQAGQPRREYTRAIAVIDSAPLLDWQVGDWLQIKTRNVWESVRVFEAGLSYKASDAVISARVTLNDRFVDASVRDAKRLKGIAHGTTQNLGSGGIPSRSDKAVPAAPKGVAANSLGYWLDAIPLSSVDVSWQAVTADTGGLALNGVDFYEVSCGGQRKRTSSTTIGFDGLQPSRIHTVTVYAVSSTGIRGESSSVEVLTAYPLAKLDPPTKPSLRTSVGAIQVSWDGKLQGSGDPYTPPLHFAYILVETRLISVAGKPWVRWSRDNGLVHTGLTAGDKYEVRLVAVDMLGKESDPSPVATVTVESEVQDALDKADAAAAEALQAKQDATNALDKAFEAEGGIQGALTAVADLDATLTPKITTAQSTATTAATAAQAAKQQAATALDKAFEAEGGVQGALDAVGNLDAELRPKITAAQDKANAADTAAKAADKAAAAAMAKATTVEGVASSAQTKAEQAKIDADQAKANALAAQTTANTAASDLITLSGRTGRTIRSATAPTGTDRNSNNLWLQTGTGKLYEWNGSAWKVITDERLTAAAAAADAAANNAALAKENAGVALTKANQAQVAADSARGIADAAQATATGAAATATSAQTKADQASGDAATAKGAADAAAQAAASAAGVAGSKADVLIQSTTPATSMRKATTLWIDTTGGNNTPKRWSGTAWVVVTDKAATDAATAAATAQAKADAAVVEATAAKEAADAAMAQGLGAQALADKANDLASTADGRITVAKRNPTTSDGAGRPAGAIWQVKTGNSRLDRYFVWAYDDSGTTEFAKTRLVDGVLKVDDTATTTTPEFLRRPDGSLAYLTGADLDKANAGLKVVDGKVSTVSLALAWRQLQATQNFIGPNSIGQAQIIDLAVGTAQIADLAVTNGKIGDLSVDKLIVTSGANIPVAVINHLFAQSATITNLRSNKVIVAGDPTNQVGSILLENGAVTAPKITASEELSAKVAQFLSVETSKISWDNAAGNNAFIGNLVSESAFITQLLAKKVIIAGDPTNKVGSVLLENGAVTAPKITASEELSAKVAQFLSVKTGQITWDNAAGNNAFIGSLVGNNAFLERLYANQIVVGAGNLVPDQRFTKPFGISWSAFYGDATPWANRVDSVEGPMLVGDASKGSGWRTVVSRPFPVQPNDLLLLQARSSRTGSWGSYVPYTSILFFNQEGNRIGVSGAIMATAGWSTQTGSYEVPAGAVTGRAVITIPDGATAGQVWVSEVSVKAKVGSVLIENGAVTTPKIFAGSITAEKIAVGALDAFQITSPLIQSVSTANRGIKWNGNSFVAYNNSGVEMIRLEGNTGAITGVTITGGTIRTAASGQRIQLVSAGDLYAYAPNGVETLRIQTADDDGGATYFRGPAVGAQRSYLRLGRGVLDGTDTAQAWLGFAGGNRPSRMWVHSYGAFYVGGERGSVQIENSTGELRLYSSAGLTGFYGLPTTTSTGQPLTMIYGGSMWSTYRNTSLSKYKLDQRDLSADDPYRVLQLRPRDWWDKTALEQVADGVEAEYLRAEGEEVPEHLAIRENMPLPHRVPGFVAEEVVEVIPELASWDGDGNLSGVAYDRVPAYLLVAVKAMKTEIDELREQLERGL